jgi:hypothetical protein
MFDEALTGFDVLEKGTRLPRVDMFIGDIIGGIFGLVGSEQQKDASAEAARIAQQTSKEQLNFLREQSDLARSDFTPYRESGYNALTQLTGVSPVTTTVSAPTGTVGTTTPVNALNYGLDSGRYVEYKQPNGTVYYYDTQRGNYLSDQELNQLRSVNLSGARPAQQQAAPTTTTTWQQTGEPLDVTGGAQKFIDLLENLEFKLDPTDEIYQWRQEQADEAINRAMAARGGYDSRVAINALRDSDMAIASDEINRQFKQNYLADYGKLVDLANLSRTMGSDKYNALLQIAGMGLGATTSGSGVGQQYTSQMSNVLGDSGVAQTFNALRQGEIGARTWEGLGTTFGDVADEAWEKYKLKY